MINICFDGNVDSALRAAAASALLQGQNMGDVLYFPENLTVGRIFPLTAKNRLAELSRIEGFSQLDHEKAWTKFHERLKTVNEEVRVWSTDASHEKLALRYLCSLLNMRWLKTFILSRKYIEDFDFDNSYPIVPIRDLMVDCRKLANEWNEIAEIEQRIFDRRMRIFENNHVKSVSEDYYDSLIVNYLALHKNDHEDYVNLPFLLTEEIERETGNLVIPELISIRLCRILSIDKNPWCPNVKVY